jgi:hypothetical protein
LGQRVCRVEAVVADVVVGAALEHVGAAARDHVDVAAERAAQLRLAARRDDLELLHGVHAVGDTAQRRRVVVGRQAVDDEVVRQVTGAAHRQRDAADGGSLREELGAGDLRRRDARDQQRQLENVAAVERHVLDLGL